MTQAEANINYYRLTSQLLPRETQQLEGNMSKKGNEEQLLRNKLKYKVIEEEHMIDIAHSLEQGRECKRIK